MRRAPFLRFALLFSPLLLALGCADSSGSTSPAGTTTSPGAPTGEALRLRFPEHANLVLDHGEGFVPATSGFASFRRQENRHPSVELVLPERGNGALRFRAGADVEIDVREIDASGEARLEGRALAYSRAGGTSFWTATAEGYEEWIHLEAGVAQRESPALSWEVSGAPLAQDGPSIVILDRNGKPGIRVTAPIAFASDGREIPARIVARGPWIELFVETDGEEVLVDPSWVAGNAMGTARRDHTATKISGGDVVVTGGTGASPLSSVEQWIAATGTWTAKAAMSVARTGHTATLLEDYRLLVVGGTSGIYQSSTAAFTSWTNTWAAGPALATARAYHTATLLADNRILVVGGTNGAALNSVELLDAASVGPFATVAPMSTTRQRHTATLLQDGRVLVAGGRNTTTLQTYEIYDPAANTWSPPKNMLVARDQHTAVRLADGKVLVAGGRTNGTAQATSEIYDPATDTWTALGSLSTARYAHTASLMWSGNVFVVGGYSATFTNTTEITGPASPLGTWSAGSTLTTARNLHTATLLDDGRLLVAGGFNATSLSSVEIFAPGADGAPCATAVDCHSGFCVDGVCCNMACNAGQCDACSIAAGSGTDGVCSNFTNTPCDDGNGCTLADTCQAGVCVGSDLLVCAPLDECFDAGTCDPIAGQCSSPQKPDGTPCSTGACQSGVCTEPALSALAGGASHSLALLDNGEVYSWGSNSSGQLGDGGSSTYRASPSLVSTLAGPVRVAQTERTIAAGNAHSLAVLSDGRIAAWGADTHGQLGNGLPKAPSQSSVSFTLPSGAAARAVSAGRDHSLAVDAGGLVFAWGRNTYGQLGDGTQTERVSPVQVEGLEHVVAVAAGGDHSFALDENGVVWSWGRDNHGQLGDDATLLNRFTPAQVALPSAATALASGLDHGLAILSGSTLWAWGRDTSGQLGDDSSFSSKPTPAQVSSLSGVLAVAAGNAHSLARLSNGAVRSWGADTFGQLGDDVILQSNPIPVLVSGVVAPDVLAAGGSHSLFGKGDSTLYAAGSDASGQLGDGPTLTYRPVPVEYTLLP